MGLSHCLPCLLPCRGLPSHGNTGCPQKKAQALAICAAEKYISELSTADSPRETYDDAGHSREHGQASGRKWHDGYNGWATNAGAWYSASGDKWAADDNWRESWQRNESWYWKSNHWHWRSWNGEWDTGTSWWPEKQDAEESEISWNRHEKSCNDSNVNEQSRQEVHLRLLGGPVTLGETSGLQTERGRWEYVIMDERRRCFAGVLQGALDQAAQQAFFDCVRCNTAWVQQSGLEGPTPRKTAWTVKPPCQCIYSYSGDAVPAQQWPEWMPKVMAAVMPLCGLHGDTDWPNSCNLNLYEGGDHSLGWHADDEPLFQGCDRDCSIISLSLGEARCFEMYAEAPGDGQPSTHVQLELHGGDLCTMEGLFQKHYWHRAPQADGTTGPRINLTWRWIVQHEEGCPLNTES